MKISPALRVASIVGALMVVQSLNPAGWAAPVLEGRLDKANALLADKHFAEAYEAYRGLILERGYKKDEYATLMQSALTCLSSLNRGSEREALVQEALGAHPANLFVALESARFYLREEPRGVVVAGEFRRGTGSGGEMVSCAERDRVRGLRILIAAQPLLEDTAIGYRNVFFCTLASLLMKGREDGKSWMLLHKTDLGQLPDMEKADFWFSRPGELGAAPVGEDDEPVFHAVPETWEAAANDGERWRWVLSQWAAKGAASEAKKALATFAVSQFGTETLARYGDVFRSGALAEAGDWALHTLAEDETIAQLATGARRFALPPDYQYLRLARELARDSELWAVKLASLLENRHQYPAAAQAWRDAIAKYGAGSDESRQKALDQIVKPWVSLEQTRPQTPVSPATFELLHRNARGVTLSVRRLDLEALVADLQKRLRGNPSKLNWWEGRIEELGRQMVEGNGARYLREEVAAWSLDLQLREGHFDTRQTVATPAPLPAGTYIVTARTDGGNEHRAVLRVEDTVILMKQMADQRHPRNARLVVLLDAESGKPLEGIDLEVFGWLEKYNLQRRGRRLTNFVTKSKTFKSDASGLVELPAKLLAEDGWDGRKILIARGAGGRFAVLGLDYLYSLPHGDETRDLKIYGITDRPLYRPGDKVRFKVWLAKPEYGAGGGLPWAGRKLELSVRDVNLEEIYKVTLSADAFGGAHGEFELPAGAKLGPYYVAASLPREDEVYFCHFRVEEYKKPEFEVAIKAPERPVALGERVEATISATYTFGAPVARGRAKIKVTRTGIEPKWWPAMPWDWLYGTGYAWYGYDYDWYPGWAEWGLRRPVPVWWYQPEPPPETVLSTEVELSADGTAPVVFDTALAKAMYGDRDHRYDISVEVTDASRRMVAAQGAALLAREPFRVHVWTERPRYRAGDNVVVRVQTRTLDDRPVLGEAELTLYRVAGYDDAGRPREEQAGAWMASVDEAGVLRHTLAASLKGQYRLVCRVTDAEGRALEGAQVFVVRGDDDDGRGYRFADIELLPDKAGYRPGETVKLQINTDAADSSVMLFVRPSNGIVKTHPQWLHLDGKTAEATIVVEAGDQPNFFVEAISVRGGKLHTETREIAVPPVERIVNVSVEPDSDKVTPGGDAGVTVRVTDAAGRPSDASVVLSVYDKAIDILAGGSNVPKMREFFWGWKRDHEPESTHTLSHAGRGYLLKGEAGMGALGMFGGTVADWGDNIAFGAETESMAPVMLGEEGRMRNMLASAAPLMQASFSSFSVTAGSGAIDAFSDGGGVIDPSDGALVYAEAAVRSRFADTAFWSPSLVSTGEKGVYRATFAMPEDVTGWKARAWAMADGVGVGEDTGEIATAKNIVLRLQAPRFFTQRDEAVLSANIHNFFEEKKRVRAALELETLDGAAVELVAGQGAAREIEVAALGEQRVDWRVRVTQPGGLKVRMKALADAESDAMERVFPVQVHGMLKTEAWSGVIRADAAGRGPDTATVRLRVPDERRAERTRLEVRWSPSLASAMLDAIPYMLEYPHRTTESTLNRFLAASVARHALDGLGLNLEAMRGRLTNLNPQELGADKERVAQWRRLSASPVFSAAELGGIVDEGLLMLERMQLSGGGWGWFSGYGEHASEHMTATVVHGLRLAREVGAEVPESLFEGGVAWLRRHQEKRVKWIGAERRQRRADNRDALVAKVLAEEGFADARMLDWLYEDRGELAFYGKALLGLAFDALKDSARRDVLARNCLQFLKRDAENQSVWFELGNSGYWWWWYGSESEAQAYGLMLLLRAEPADEAAAAGLVKYLLNNRRHATYWSSTRDTALCVEALAEYLARTGEGQPEMEVEVFLDGELVKTVEITPERMLDFDNVFVVEGAALGAGEHTLTLARKGEGPLYFNAYLTNFTLEDPIAATGAEIKVARRVYRLKETGADAAGRGSRGQSVAQRREKHQRELLEDGEVVKSGDLLEIELEIESGNDYEYLVFEDMRAAGCEALEQRSGYQSGGLPAYVEYRDNRVVFFLRQLRRGRHSVSYRLRAEVPGRFSALPATAYGMYAPELRANSDEAKILIAD